MKELLDQVGLVISLLSMSILLFGLLVKRFWQYWVYKYLLVLFTLELTSFVLGILLKRNDYILLLVSLFTSFMFLTYYYYKDVRLFNNKVKIGLFGFGTVLFCVSFVNVFYPFVPIVLYLYSVGVTVYSLFYFYNLLKRKRSNPKHSLVLNYGILFFFVLTPVYL